MPEVIRHAHRARVEQLLRQSPIVAVLGARQVGKSTLARQVAARAGKRVSFFDLEDAATVTELAEPMLALGPLRGLVVLDEIQLRPGLFATLRVLADRPRTPARFLILGSASPELLRQGAETLAGRVAFHELTGFDMDEVPAAKLDALWLRGGFPRSLLARTDAASVDWRRDFILTFLERDVPRLGIGIAPRTLDRFWAMVAHYHGQILNTSEIGRSFGMSHTSVRNYLDVLIATYVVRELRPWHENLGKRLVKSPKVYVADTGLLHTLLGVQTRRDLMRHPKLGASFEGFAIEQIVSRLGAHHRDCYFWATHGGAELDLLVVRGSKRLGFEIKHTDAPVVSASMRSAITDLRLDRLDVIHAGTRSYSLGDRIRALPLRDLPATELR
jgi:uncharacterized protein